METEKYLENVSKYYCKKCDYHTSRKSNWEKHILTQKHKMETDFRHLGKKVANNYYCEKCDYVTSKLSHWNDHIKTRKHTKEALVVQLIDQWRPGQRLLRNGHMLRITGVGRDQLFDWRADRGREEDGLPVGRGRREDRFDVIPKAHVEHAIINYTVQIKTREYGKIFRVQEVTSVGTTHNVEQILPFPNFLKPKTDIIICAVDANGEGGTLNADFDIALVQ